MGVILTLMAELKWVCARSMERADIIECETFPMVFFAGPGTGKTYTCRAHCQYLAEQGYNVLALSFTKAAASQLAMDGVDARTIDSFYYYWLDRFDMLDKFEGRNFEYLAQQFTRLLKEHAEFKGKLQATYDCVIVDEGQDCNRHQLANLWEVASNEYLQIFADIDQCIYEWRYAEPNTLLEFVDYHKIKPINLDYSYRLTTQVLSHATQLIRNNNKRFSVTLQAGKSGPEIEYEETINDIEATLKRIKEINSDDTAVLSRNVTRRTYMNSFWQQGFSRVPASHKPYAGTIHGAKGLEWKNVFIPRADMYEFKGSALEEERRIFYTAMTRSSNFLHITAFRPVCFISEAGLRARL